MYPAAVSTKGRPSAKSNCRPSVAPRCIEPRAASTGAAVGERPGSGDSTRSAGRLIMASPSSVMAAKSRPDAPRAVSTGFGGIRTAAHNLADSYACLDREPPAVKAARPSAKAAASPRSKASGAVCDGLAKLAGAKRGARSPSAAPRKVLAAPAQAQLRPSSASAAEPPGVEPIVSIDRKAEEQRRGALVEALRSVPVFDPASDVGAFHGRAYALSVPQAANTAEPPRVVWESDKKPRQNSPDWLTATEYADEPAVLKAKVHMLASLLRASRRTLAYTGAGLSVAAGIGMAAVGSTGGGGMGVATAGEPTLSHCVMAELNRQNLLHGWVQQNHDGLPQKAGYRQEDINEIHGSWFDPSNPVVKYSGRLRHDFCDDMVMQAETADLTVVLGTSLTGLNADQCVTEPAERATKGQSLGSVIISPQRTDQDGRCSLRIFAKADDVMTMLAAEFGFGPRAFGRGAKVKRSADLFIKSNKVLVPYDKSGKLSTTVKTYWDLSSGQKLRLGDHHNLKGAKQPQDAKITTTTIGTSAGRDERTCSIGINFEGTNKRIGLWWLETAQRGGVAQLPVVNVDAQEMKC